MRSSVECPDCGVEVMRGVNHSRYCPRRLHLLRDHARRQHVGALHPDCPGCQKFGSGVLLLVAPPRKEHDQ